MTIVTTVTIVTIVTIDSILPQKLANATDLLNFQNSGIVQKLRSLLL